MKKLVLFGAGKIGRSFIGQLFARSGYEVVFIDINGKIIDELNLKRQYKVVIKSNLPDEIIFVKNVRGVHGNKKHQVISELTDCDLAAVSVGQRGLEAIIPIIAEGLKKRVERGEKGALDIIIAENMRNADELISSGLVKHLGEDFPVREMVGLIETSIGKMVPLMPEEEIGVDPLLVYAEPYNTLILDKKAFKNPIPEVEGLDPKENIKAWVDRKSYIHNLGHAAVAYAGYLYNPDQKYIYEALSNLSVKAFTIKTMHQSADILMKKYPGEFTKEDMTDHIEKLIGRFGNQALKDTIYRVGSDLKRKLNKDDRILSPLIDGLSLGLPVDYIMMVFAFGLCFKAKNEKGERSVDDNDFFNLLRKNGLEYIMTNVLKMNAKTFMDSIFVQ